MEHEQAGINASVFKGSPTKVEDEDVYLPILEHPHSEYYVSMGFTAPRVFGDLGRRAIYFQGAGEDWNLFLGSKLIVLEHRCSNL